MSSTDHTPGGEVPGPAPPPAEDLEPDVEGDPVEPDAVAVAPADPDTGEPLSVEELVDDLERLTKERDEYLDALRRSQADFENYRKRIMKQQADAVERAASTLVDTLLPVLDACDGAVQHGATDVEPILASLLGTLEKEGLERLDPVGEPFDPTRHEAVMHEPADPESDGGDTLVVDVMRRGYAWKGRVVRAAMVKVKG